MRPGTIRLTGDDFKASHADYRQLLRQDPRGAGAAIRADYRAWFAQVEQFVRDRRGDVVMAAAPGSADELFDSALPFFQADYAVEVVVLAVRATDSRMATALGPIRRPDLRLSSDLHKRPPFRPASTRSGPHQAVSARRHVPVGTPHGNRERVDA
ncbi:zeta toxin family protein [Streptomyces mirabilis]|uniref:zeta toxin family protein n=1 Tax=Streptomyces mirabilis TaxID=68239 RepID=UPI0033215164